MIRGKFSGSFKIKLMSVLIAFGMWIFVMEKIDPIRVESIENVPIAEITNIDELYDNGLALSYDQKLSVNIDFRGKRSSLLDFLRKDPEVKATIPSPAVGENKVELVVTVPSDIEYSVEPGNFYITLEESVTSSRSIEIAHLGTPAKGYSIKGIEMNSSEAVVEGPKSQVEKINKLLGTVNVEGINKDYSVSVRLIPVDSKGAEVSGVTVKREFTSVTIGVEQSKDVPVKIRFVDEDGNVVENNSYTTDIKTVTITGAPSRLQTITEVYTQDILVDDFNQYIDRAFDLAKIEGVKMSAGRVNISAQSDLEQEYLFHVPAEDVRLIYSNDVERIRQAIPSQVEVRFKASREYEDSLSVEDITLYVDNKDVAEAYGIRFKIRYPVSDVEVNPNIFMMNQGE